MPAISAPAKVLVTGASGYIATSCVKALIDKGFSVRGTVRKASKGEYLEKLFGDKFESIIVEDMAVVSRCTFLHTSCVNLHVIAWRLR